MKKTVMEGFYMLLCVLALVALMLAVSKALAGPVASYSYATKECVSVDTGISCEELPENHRSIWVE